MTKPNEIDLDEEFHNAINNFAIDNNEETNDWNYKKSYIKLEWIFMPLGHDLVIQIFLWD